MQPFDQAWILLKAGPYARRGSMTGVPEKLTQNRYRTLDAEGNLGFLGPQHNDMEAHEVLPLLAQRGMSEGKLIDTHGAAPYVPKMMHSFKDGQVVSAMHTEGVNDPNSTFAQSTPSVENRGKGAQFDYYGELPMSFEEFANYTTE